MRREKGTFDMKFDIVRAWKDEAYRQQLSSEELALLPANPVGEFELSDAELEAIHGAHHKEEEKEINFFSVNGDVTVQDPPPFFFSAITSVLAPTGPTTQICNAS